MKNTFIITLTVLAVIKGSGCTAGNQDIYRKPETVKLKQPLKETLKGQSYDNVSDSQDVSAAQKCGLELTLEQCLETAFENNPEIMQRQWDTETSLAGKDIAEGALWPTISAEGGYEHFREDRLIQPRRPGTSEVLQFTDDLVSGDIVLNMPLYTGGRLQNQVKAADLLAKSAQHQLAHSQRELVFNITSVFYSMLGQKEVINSLIFSQETLREHFKRTKELMEAQKAAHVDLLRTEVRLADIEQQLLRERNTLDIQRFLLTSLLGCDTETEVLDIKGQLILGDIPDELDRGFTLAMAYRQDYQSLISRVDVQRKMLDVAKSRRLPEISLRASYGSRWDSDDFDEDNEVGSVGLFAEMPLFEGGRIDAGIRRERSRLRSIEESLRRLKLQIQVEVETAASNIESTRARVGVTEKAVEMAKESLRIEREKYDLGKGAIVDVLDAQSALLSSQMNYYRALADCNTAIAQFRQAAGLPCGDDVNP
ncbi:Outer membrane protein TolC precursor [Limihaloglobus sulfuriphilus]|uniref:Outer membrane protein TolC n=1 Tax=Limihaloglobus sulfuriphilus TaxID=1851148 RepID=A0A1R7T5U4_9BACT|nr:TolC family protein [Limihaloglobus sulfuriphilus]AQQ71786.1 Outer membrane protein TolC precursor [Limihaloglobus sulfuriphilus]